jgi:hypothetical protein
MITCACMAFPDWMRISAVPTAVGDRDHLDGVQHYQEHRNEYWLDPMLKGAEVLAGSVPSNSAHSIRCSVEQENIGGEFVVTRKPFG